LGAVSFFTDASTEIVYPLLPMFLMVLGAGPALIGVIEGIAETTASLLKLVSGWASDRLRKRKAIIIFGYGLSSLTRPLMAMAALPWHVLAVRFTDRVGKGFRGAPRDALIADSTDPAIRGRAFGFHRAMDHLGAVAGPLAAFLLLRWLMVDGGGDGGDPDADTMRSVFWAASVPATLAVATLLLFVKEVAPISATTRRLPSLRMAPFGKPFRNYIGVLILFTLGNSSDAFLLLRAHDLGVSPTLIPILWASFTL